MSSKVDINHSKASRYGSAPSMWWSMISYTGRSAISYLMNGTLYHNTIWLNHWMTNTVASFKTQYLRWLPMQLLNNFSSSYYLCTEQQGGRNVYVVCSAVSQTTREITAGLLIWWQKKDKQALFSLPSVLSGKPQHWWRHVEKSGRSLRNQKIMRLALESTGL